MKRLELWVAQVCSLLAELAQPGREHSHDVAKPESQETVIVSRPMQWPLATCILTVYRWSLLQAMQ